MADTTGDGSTGASGTGASATTQSQTSTTATAPATAPQTQQEVDRIVLNYLNQKGYKQAEYVLKREANLMTMEELEASFPLEQGGPIYVMPFEKAEMTSPDAYDVAYSSLRRWVENSLDLYKVRRNLCRVSIVVRGVQEHVLINTLCFYLFINSQS